MENIFFPNLKKKSALFLSMLVMMHDDPPKYQSLLEVIHYSLVSWWECASCEGFMLCISSIIHLFVVFLCRPVDYVAFVYLRSAEPMPLGLVVREGISFS